MNRDFSFYRFSSFAFYLGKAHCGIVDEVVLG